MQHMRGALRGSLDLCASVLERLGYIPPASAQVGCRAHFAGPLGRREGERSNAEVARPRARDRPDPSHDPTLVTTTIGEPVRDLCTSLQCATGDVVRVRAELEPELVHDAIAKLTDSHRELVTPTPCAARSSWSSVYSSRGSGASLRQSTVSPIGPTTSAGRCAPSSKGLTERRSESANSARDYRCHDSALVSILRHGDGRTTRPGGVRVDR